MADATGSEHSTSDQAKAANAASDADTPSTSSSSSGSNTPYTVDYGTSKVYSKADIDAAIQVVMAEFDTWKGATMKYIGYTNDDDSIHDIEYAVRLGVDIDPSYTQSIILTSYFHSPSGKDAEGTAWDPDKDYNDWLWHLVRADGGDWKLLTWGYV